MKLSQILVIAILLSLPLNSCHSFTFATPIQRSIRSTDQASGSIKVLWSGSFDNPQWMKHWHIERQHSWGWQNIAVVVDTSRQFAKVLRVSYPAGSASPEASRSQGSPIGGGQFIANLGIEPADKLRLSYSVRFSDNFDFVKGGKLPGLFGGVANSGGRTPNGTDGFSTRYMWRRQGDGEVYAYLPTSKQHGTSLGRGAWRFKPGVWYAIEQEVTLNQPGQKNGQVQVWVNGVQVFKQSGLVFRTSPKLEIEGVFFSTFFGGSDTSWATPKRAYADFADFFVSTFP